MFDGTIKLWNLTLPLKARHACSPYQFTRGPTRVRGPSLGFGGYLSRNGRVIDEGSLCRLRVVRADEVIRLTHKGWYCDRFQCETMYGLLARLPRRRGFLAGWTMGEGMATSFDGYVYSNIEDAAHAADQEAQREAERQIEFEEAEAARLAAEEQEAELWAGG